MPATEGVAAPARIIGAASHGIDCESLVIRRMRLYVACRSMSETAVVASARDAARARRAGGCARRGSASPGGCCSGLAAVAAVLGLPARSWRRAPRAHALERGAQHAAGARAARPQRQHRTREAGGLRPRGQRIRAGAQRRRPGYLNDAGAALESPRSANISTRARCRSSARRRRPARAVTRHIDSARQLAEPRGAARAMGRRAPGGARSRLPAHRRRRRHGTRHQRHAGGRATLARRACRRPSMRCAAASDQPGGHRAARAGFPQAVLNAHQAEFESSPGKAWLGLVRQDFQRPRGCACRWSATTRQSGAEWHRLFDDGAALTAGVQQQLQQPARQRAAAGGRARREPPPRSAEHTLRDTGAAVLATAAGGVGAAAASISAAGAAAHGRDAPARRRRSQRARPARRLGRDRRAGRVLQHHGRPHRTRGGRAARASGGARAARRPSARSSCTTWRITIR